MAHRKLRIAILGDPKDLHVRRWCAGLAARGLEISNVCGQLPAHHDPGVAYLEFHAPRFGLRPPHRRSVRLRRRLRELFRQFDIVHMHNLHNWGIDEDLVSGGKLMISTYGADVLPGYLPAQGQDTVIDQNLHTLRAKRQALALADHLTATSAFLAESTSAYGNIPRHQIEVIPFGVDPELFAPQRVERSESGHVGYCGGFKPNKGAAQFIDAAPLVRRQFPSCTFDLYGAGDSRPELEALVSSRDHQQAIRFHDFVPHHRLPQVLDTFDLLAVPSCVRESYCVTAVEAQAMELPVVASRIGGLPDTIRDGRTGVLVEPASPPALAEGICELLSDEEKRRRLGRAARQWVISRHNWARCLDRMIDAYTRVAAGYSRRRTTLSLLLE